MSRFLRFLAKAYAYEPTRMLINGILMMAGAAVLAQLMALWIRS